MKPRRTRSLRWSAPLPLALALIGLPTAVSAQTALITLGDASILEGADRTTKILKVPVFHPGNSAEIKGTVSTTFTRGSATGGATCATGVDFEDFNSDFTIPANTPAETTLTVNIKICGDGADETDESIKLTLLNLQHAACSDGCVGTGTIFDDDGPPDIASINDISVSHLSGQPITATFTVNLRYANPGPNDVTVHFATADGSAKGRTLNNPGSYIPASGTLRLPPNASSGTIPVSIQPLGSGTFLMNLSQASTGSTIRDTSAQCTITIRTLTTGNFDLSPDDARVPVRDTAIYAVGWTVPDGEVWRDLDTIDLRIRRGQQTALWVRWDEASNAIALCEGPDAGLPSEAVCTPGGVLGDPVVLETPYARVDLAASSVVGSGVTGPHVTLNLAISFDPSAGGSYRVELAAADDFGRQDEFVEASDVHVIPHEGASRP